ncbi:adenosylhomocysteine nucleosidase [Actinocorallia herbida]|uniref:Adenosylhomocysteine nucleosidase n=1 Tax=Actinocorallia herbida TaxID=58109 RepID=A0A3N1DA57_9ACTN|nr:nucleosidase [Actinocorallia herbida]ROO90413.1 adenosylhomocysteine nucleosidase [Actinocorallia herbida]
MRLTGIIAPDLPLLVVAADEEATYLGRELPVLLTGIGKVNAAVSVAAVLARHTPAEIINLGTAGALRPGIHGTHEVARVIQHDLDGRGISALTGRPTGEPFELRAEGLVLATGDVFVSAEDVRVKLAADAHLVDMEGYAVAAAAAAAGVPVRLVKHVSDGADDDSAKTWKESVDDCARDLAAWVSTHL